MAFETKIESPLGLYNNNIGGIRFADTVWQLDVSNPNIITSSSNYFITKIDGLDALYISASTSGTITVTIKPNYFNFNTIDKVKMYSSVTVKSNGIKQSSVAFKYLDTAENNSENWMDINITSGTYDWTEFNVINNDIANNSRPEYCKILFNGPGEMWIKELKIRVMEIQYDRSNLTSGYTPTFPKGRGANISSIASLKDLIDFKNTYNGNLVRLQIEDILWSRWITYEVTDAGIPYMDNQVPDTSAINALDVSAYYNWMEYKFTRIDEILKYAKMNDIKVIIDMHKPIGGHTSDINPYATINDTYCYHYYKIWEMIANRYKGNDSVFAYDLINEPYETKFLNRGPLSRNYIKLQKEVINIIRKIDQDIPLIVEFTNFAGPESAAYLSAFSDTNLIYSFHTYFPGEYVDANNTTSAYPSGCYYNGRPIDKSILREVVQPVREFQLKYQVPILVGEFSCFRWNPGGNNYLNDYIDIFDEYGWHWVYFSFRDGADMWDLEFNDLPAGQNNSTYSISSTPRNDVIKTKLSTNISLYTSAEQTPIVPILSAEQYNDNILELKWLWPNCYAKTFNIRTKESSASNFNLIHSLQPLTASTLNSATVSSFNLFKNYNINIELSSTYGKASATTNYSMIPLYPTLSSTSGVSRAFSLRKVNSNYSGNCLRIRRSIDNSELDIGFNSSGYLNTSAISAFCTSSNGYVVTWYDQISGNNITNILSENQPIIMSAGNIFNIEENGLPGIYFGKSNSFLSGSPGMYNLSGNSVYIVKKDDQISATGSVIGEFNTSTLNTLYSFYRTNTKNLGIVIRYDGGSSIFGDIFTSASNISGVHQISIIDSKSNIGGYINNGSIKSPNQNYSIISAITVDIFSIGARVRTFNDQFYNGRIQEIIILSNNSLQVDREYISKNQVRHYNC